MSKLRVAFTVIGKGLFKKPPPDCLLHYREEDLESDLLSLMTMYGVDALTAQRYDATLVEDGRQEAEHALV